MYKKLPTNQKPLIASPDADEFAAEWKAKCVNKKSDLTRLYELILPTFKAWEEMLVSGSYSKDINIFTMVRLLSSDPHISDMKIKAWIKETKIKSSIVDELTMLFMTTMRRYRFVSQTNSSNMVEYIVIRDIKFALKDLINSSWARVKHRKSFGYYLKGEYEDSYYQELPDYFLLYILRKDRWLNYLSTLILEGYTTYERSDIVQIKRQNLFAEEKKLWLLLKDKL
jgi:hypothetical protein